MKPVHFHFIRTLSFVRRWNRDPLPQISPTSGCKFIPVPKSPSSPPPHLHPPTHPLTRQPRFPQPTTAAWHSRSTFSAQPLQHTQEHAHTRRLQTFNCETSDWVCIYYHQLTRESLCSVYLFVCLFFITSYSRARFINQPKGSFDSDYLSELSTINLVCG